MYTMYDKRHWLILQCRYYNGESCPPLGIKKANAELLWDYERLWVEWSLKDGDEIESFKHEFFYYELTLHEGDKTPLTMKALLFNRYLHWSMDYSSLIQEKKAFENGFYASYLSRKTNRERRADKRRAELIPQCRIYHGEAENPYKHSSHKVLWLWEKEWVEGLAYSYRNRERFFEELMNTPCLGSTPLPFWKDLAHELGIPATLLACIGKNYGASYSGFTHEMEENFYWFIKKYAKE